MLKLFTESDWVLAHKEKVQQPPKIISCTGGKDVPPLQTLTFSVNVQTSPRKNMLVSLQNGVLNILVPQTEKVESEKIQGKIHQGIEAALRFEAKRILPGKLKKLSEKHALPFADVKIQQSKTRWGSCSSKKNINLSYFLLLLPEHLVDYVLLHELVHTREMNHSARFWALLDRLTNGQAKALAKEMKSYKTGV